MKTKRLKPWYHQFCTAFMIVLCITTTTVAIAQDSASTNPDSRVISTKITQLNRIQNAIDSKIANRANLREAMKTAEADSVPDLEADIAELNQEIKSLQYSFEQLAAGEVDISLFNQQAETMEWREQLTLILTPLLQNLERLTEKPRRIEELRARIAFASAQVANTEEALASMRSALEAVEAEKTRTSLQRLVDSWSEQQEELQQEIASSNLQLTNLQRTDGPIWTRARDALWGFVTGRGLTLVIATIVGLTVWIILKLTTRIFTQRGQGEDTKHFRTRQRLVHYGFKILTVALVMISVLVVFYTRGDVLLMAISFLLVAGIALGLRHTVPRFIEETRLLLNFGSIREDERVIYRGLPWKVTKLNISRPAGKESWAPASKHDYILLDDGEICKVLNLSPEHVELENLAGTKRTMVTTEFFTIHFLNLSRSEAFSVSSTFGIGYSHQQDSVQLVPETFRQAILQALHNTDMTNDVISVSVELEAAGASSLDYWIGVKMSSNAAKSYFRISRLIQQVCVTTCTEKNWDIPFPQLTLHRQ